MRFQLGVFRESGTQARYGALGPHVHNLVAAQPNKTVKLTAAYNHGFSRLQSRPSVVPSSVAAAAAYGRR